MAKLVTIMRRVRPTAVVTFDPKGGYGHPDHIAIHDHTVAAFRLAGDTAYRPDVGAPWQPARLFYRAMSRSQFNTMRDAVDAAGLESKFYTYLEENGMIWEDDAISLTVDVADMTARKLAAIRCHATQFGAESIFRQLPEEEMAEILRYEYFALARPTPPPGLHLTDLFAGWEAAPAA